MHNAPLLQCGVTANGTVFMMKECPAQWPGMESFFTSAYGPQEQI
jgi:hypothetical protein